MINNGFYDWYGRFETVAQRFAAAFSNSTELENAEGRRKLEAIQYANEQQLVALAKQEGFEMRPYIR